MYIRKLVPSDAPLMLEWMHTPDISRHFRADFASMTIDDAERFVRSSRKMTPDGSINAAVSSDTDEYMGTVSLKHTDFIGGSAEFAIVTRSCAMGKGFAWFAMNWIITGAFRDLGLNLVYWNVLKDNHRAVRFYDKHNFSEMLDVPAEFLKHYEGIENLKWYYVNSPMTDEKTPPIIDSRLTTHDSRLTTHDSRLTLVFCLYENSCRLYSYTDFIYVDRDFLSIH